MEFNIYFQDLSEEMQGRVWNTVEKVLRNDGEIKEENEEHKDEIIDDYINTHNFANEFVL